MFEKRCRVAERLAEVAAVILFAVVLFGCSAFPTQRARVANYANDYAFYQAEGTRLCTPVAFKGCDAAKAALKRMKTHLDETAALSKDGHLTLQLRALKRDEKAVKASGIFK